MIENKFEEAWKSFCEYYKNSRKAFEDFDKRSEFHGPHFREESDIVFHLARFCYDSFGDGYVHLESPIYKMYFSILEQEPEPKKRRVDIEISSPESFMTKDSKRQVFAEMKWVWRGINKYRGGSYLKNMITGIENDLEKLQYLHEKGCCESAFMCIIDEEPELTQINQQRKLKWEQTYNQVKVLLQSYHGPL
jgi:hypothetical protein